VAFLDCSLTGVRELPRFDRLEFDQPEEQAGTGPAPPPEPVRDEHYWLRLAVDNRRQGLHENALRMYSRALEKDKSLVDGWVGQVQMLVLLGEYPEADLWARKALELFRNHADLLAARAQALCRRGDRAQAHSLSDAAMAQAGQSAYRWMVRGELMVASNQDMDRYCFDRAAQVEPDWLINLEIALIYQFYRQPAKALPRIRAVVEQTPDNAYPWFLQGCIQDELGFTSQAQASLNRCLELVPGYTDAKMHLARITNRGWSLSRALRRVFSIFRVIPGFYLIKKASRFVDVPRVLGKLQEQI
jgi:tetratricopeptide (TPR) repeat protein